MLNMPKIDNDDTKNVCHYIYHTWSMLTREKRNIAHAACDPKCPEETSPYTVYIPRDEDYSAIVSDLKSEIPLHDWDKISLKRLPDENTHPTEPGLLYLPNAYVVPGGRFNEQYGWDSFFIIKGLLEDGFIDLARGMVDNCVYQVDHYGKILNANRSYYLDRSHPPLLTRMIVAVYKQTRDKKWLASVLPSVHQMYERWTQSPHEIPRLELSRYYVSASGPAPEVLLSEDSNERRYYRQALQYFDEHVLEQPHFRRFYNPRTHQLTPAFYKSDRSVRESGFDLSGKYGPFGVEIIDHAPVGLNTLIYQMEADMAYCEQEVGNSQNSDYWQDKAKKRVRRIDRYFWDPELGYFFDYNYRQHRRRPYVFATTFLPLWAGIASEEQAERIVHNLNNLEADGGLKTSSYVTGSQWDAPFGWAPMQYFAVHGLKRYGYHKEAKRIAAKFVNMLNQDFKHYGVLMEKYDVVTCQSHVTHEIRRGYRSNEIGFGWTNGVYRDFVNNILDQ